MDSSWWLYQSSYMYSEKATKFFEISTLLLSYGVPVKSKVEISQNFVAFSEYMNFIKAHNQTHNQQATDKKTGKLAKSIKVAWIVCKLSA